MNKLTSHQIEQEIQEIQERIDDLQKHLAEQEDAAWLTISATNIHIVPNGDYLEMAIEIG